MRASLLAAMVAVAGDPSVCEKTRTVDEAIAAASSAPEQLSAYSCWRGKYPGPDGDEIVTPWHKNLTTTTATGYTCALDWLAKAMGQGPSMAFATIAAWPNATITISGTSVTNSAAAFPTSGQGLAGSIVVVFGITSATIRYGVITSNTSTALTVDQWYDATSTAGAAGATPTTSGGNATAGIGYIVLPGQNPASWMSLSASVFTPSTADNALSSQGAELTSSVGLARAVGTFAHTALGTTYTLIHLWTASGAGSVVNNEGISGAATLLSTPNWGGAFPFESAEPSPPTLLSGDTLQNTCTITI